VDGDELGGSMEKKKWEPAIGEKLICYIDGYREMGEFIFEKDSRWCVAFGRDLTKRREFVHPKQCRRLVPKKRHADITAKPSIERSMITPERIAELRAGLKASKGTTFFHYGITNKELEWLLNEIEMLRGAFEFYGQKRSYINIGVQSDLYADSGKRAREALTGGQK
jgi:hypothetical protein